MNSIASGNIRFGPNVPPSNRSRHKQKTGSDIDDSFSHLDHISLQRFTKERKGFAQ
jgi:hypothetical protein